MNINSIDNILIIRLSSLGDILLATPLIRSIKKKNANVKIDFLLREEYKDTLKYNPHLNQILLFKRNDNSNLLSDLKNKNYDLVIDLQNNFRSRKLRKSFQTQIVHFKKPTLNKFLLVKFKINRFKQIIPIPVRYARAVPKFMLDENSLELFLPDNIKSNVLPNSNTIGICPGAKHFTKMYPEKYFIELGNKLINKGFKIVLLGGKDDKSVCDRITNNISGAVNLSNNNNLLQLSAEMKNCKFVICNDSGLMHTAIAVGTPVVALFGSTVKEFGFFPYNCKHLLIENNSLKCRPCSHIGKEKCPKKHFKCMEELTPNLVFKEILTFNNSL